MSLCLSNTSCNVPKMKKILMLMLHGGPVNLCIIPQPLALNVIIRLSTNVFATSYKTATELFSHLGDISELCYHALIFQVKMSQVIPIFPNDIYINQQLIFWKTKQCNHINWGNLCLYALDQHDNSVICTPLALGDLWLSSTWNTIWPIRQFS